MPDIRIDEIRGLVDVLSRCELERDELRSVLLNKLSGIGSRFENLLDFLISIGLVKVDKEFRALSEHVKYDDSYVYLISSILNSTVCIRDFSHHCKSVQIVTKPTRSIIINSARTNFPFLWFLSLLEQLGVLERLHKPFYKVTPEFEELFLEFVRNSHAHQITGKGVTPEKLAKRQLQNQILGLEAELFCMAYEKSRLENHPHVSNIRHIALEDVSAGFDILSFDGVTDLIPNRQIEVKSWVTEKRFFLSKSEYEIAKHSGDQYYLYLVNRCSMNETGYTPDIFKNPYDTFFHSETDWQIEPDGWFIHRR